MRATLNIDADVLFAAKEIAKKEGISIGKAVSGLARHALRYQSEEKHTRNGIPLFPRQPGAKEITLELVNQLRGGKLATLDQHIPVTAVAGGADALELLTP